MANLPSGGYLVELPDGSFSYIVGKLAFLIREHPVSLDQKGAELIAANDARLPRGGKVVKLPDESFVYKVGAGSGFSINENRQVPPLRDLAAAKVIELATAADSKSVVDRTATLEAHIEGHAKPEPSRDNDKGKEKERLDVELSQEKGKGKEHSDVEPSQEKRKGKERVDSANDAMSDDERDPILRLLALEKAEDHSFELPLVYDPVRLALERLHRRTFHPDGLVQQEQVEPERKQQHHRVCNSSGETLQVGRDDKKVTVSRRGADGVWGSPTVIVEDQGIIGRPMAAINNAGHAAILWSSRMAGGIVMKVSERRSGGSFSEPIPVPLPVSLQTPPAAQILVNHEGNVFLTWVNGLGDERAVFGRWLKTEDIETGITPFSNSGRPFPSTLNKGTRKHIINATREHVDLAAPDEPVEIPSQKQAVRSWSAPVEIVRGSHVVEYMVKLVADQKPVVAWREKRNEVAPPAAAVHQEAIKLRVEGPDGWGPVETVASPTSDEMASWELRTNTRGDVLIDWNEGPPHNIVADIELGAGPVEGENPAGAVEGAAAPAPANEAGAQPAANQPNPPVAPPPVAPPALNNEGAAQNEPGGQVELAPEPDLPALEDDDPNAVAANSEQSNLESYPHISWFGKSKIRARAPDGRWEETQTLSDRVDLNYAHPQIALSNSGRVMVVVKEDISDPLQPSANHQSQSRLSTAIRRPDGVWEPLQPLASIPQNVALELLPHDDGATLVWTENSNSQSNRFIQELNLQTLTEGAQLQPTRTESQRWQAPARLIAEIPEFERRWRLVSTPDEPILIFRVMTPHGLRERVAKRNAAGEWTVVSENERLNLLRVIRDTDETSATPVKQVELVDNEGNVGFGG